MADLSAAELALLFRLPPEDAIAFLERKGMAISWNWFDLWEEQHSKAFTVAKLTREDILADIRDEVEAIFEQGITRREFRDRLAPRLKAKGWWGKKVVVDSAGGAEIVQEGSPWRLDTIFRPNAQAGYMAGRYRQQVDNAGERPYLQYVAILDSGTRPSHAAMHGKVFPISDPIWRSIMPPNGWGCRCRTRALTARQVEAMGVEIESSEGRIGERLVRVGVDRRSGEEILRPVTTLTIADPETGRPMEWHPDPGWSYNPALGQDAELEALLQQRLQENRG